jgi:hypothetical protein
MQEHLNLLGMRVEDKVTGFAGVVVSISFDLYGCVQALVNPGKNPDGKLGDQCWLDVARLTITSGGPVMDRPDFDVGQQADGKQGAAEKPGAMKV